MTEPSTYTITIRCRNCDESCCRTIPCGESVQEHMEKTKCKNCGLLLSGKKAA